MVNGAKRAKKRARHRRTSHTAPPLHYGNQPPSVVTRPKVDPAPRLKDGERWYVVLARPFKVQDDKGRLLSADERITEAGFTCYRPRYSVDVVRRGKAMTVQRCLFQSYACVGFNRNELEPNGRDLKWLRLLHIPGVEALLTSRTTFQPLAVPTADIDGLCQSIEASFPKPPVFLRGEHVTLSEGPFAGFAATITEAGPGDSVWLEADLLGKSTRIHVPLHEIQKA
jgi:transcription antitermination factor NusG